MKTTVTLFAFLLSVSFSAQCFSEPCPGDACSDPMYVMGPTYDNPATCGEPVTNGCTTSGVIIYWYCNDEDGSTPTAYVDSIGDNCWTAERDYFIELDLTEPLASYEITVTSDYATQPGAPYSGGIQIAVYNQCPNEEVCVPCADVNGVDGVGVDDMLLILAQFGINNCGDCEGVDINCPPDGNVDSQDLLVLTSQFGSECPEGELPYPIAHSPCSAEVSGDSWSDPTDDWLIQDWTLTLNDLPAGQYIIHVDGWGYSYGTSLVCVEIIDP